MDDNLTNKELQEKIREWINIILTDTKVIRNQNAEIWDHLSPTYSNVRKIYDMTDDLLKQNKALKSQISDLGKRLESIENNKNNQY